MGILGEARNLWMKFNVRGAILTSLFLQVFLIFLAPNRKRCSNRWFLMLIWSAYLCADLVANYALGLISKAQFTATSNSEADAHGDLLAFWAPFLLLHLGGPDTITAFALEDNELWHRHLLNLLFQLGAASYVFYQSFPSSRLIVPTILTFIGGTIKYMERTRALYLASFSNFRDSLLPPVHPWLDEAELLKSDTKRPQEVMFWLMDVSNQHKKPVIENAFLLFTIFKGLLVDLIYSYREREQSSWFFRRITAKEAFQVIEAELNFFYDVLYTKAAIVLCPTGYVFRAISIGSIVSASAGFYVLNKHGFHEYDIRITYTLLLGAIGLEFVALGRLICSDWTIAKNATSESSFFKFLLRFKSESPPFALHIQTARWSKTMFQYSFIDSRLKGKWPKWIVKPLGLIPLEEWIDDLKPRRVEKFNETLGELIFEELTRKSSDPQNLPEDSIDEELKRLGASRGEWALRNTKTMQNCEELLRFVRDVDYGESLLLWHIATELCYNTDESTNHRREENTDESTDESINHRPDESADESTNHRRKENTDESTNHHPKENSKVLSDYMLHLMKQPNMMSAVIGIGLIRFRDTCADVDWLFRINEPDSKMDACRKLISNPTDGWPYEVDRDISKSVFFDACILAKKLGEFQADEKWVIVSEVWVELVGYAAIKCQPFMHAQQLSKGGQLVTLVWLLMVHLGLSDHFQLKIGPVR